MPTVTEIHDIAPIAQFLASNGIANGALYGRKPNPNLAMQIYLIRKPVEWLYDLEDIANGATPSASLVQTSNYLYSWLGQYGLEALELQNAGGIIPNPSGSTVYGLPITALYTATYDNQSVFPLSLASGARVILVERGAAPPLASSSYSYTSPDLTLLGGIVLNTDDDLTYQYVLPIT